jgi:hypothetical protein
MQCHWDEKSTEKRCSTIWVQTMHLHTLMDCLKEVSKMDDLEVF